jgi:hypothetical protein
MVANYQKVAGCLKILSLDERLSRAILTKNRGLNLPPFGR